MHALRRPSDDAVLVEETTCGNALLAWAEGVRRLAHREAGMTCCDRPVRLERWMNCSEPKVAKARYLLNEIMLTPF